MNSDFKDLLSTFNAHRVEYLIVGAHALAVHGLVRATKNFDLWIRPTAENAERVLQALAAFGAPLHDLGAADLAQPGLVFQIGVAPLRIDLLTEIDGVIFETAWRRRIGVNLAGLEAPVLAREDLLSNKLSICTMQDLADVEQLERDAREPG